MGVHLMHYISISLFHINSEPRIYGVIHDERNV